jgi:outer membrane protein assembly factor BamD (BamD/ComL family)
MKPHLLIVFACIYAILSSGCVTFKPKAEYVSEPDYNTRVKVKDPYFKGRLNALGITTSIGFAAAGGYLGYKSDFIRYSSKSEGRVVTNKYANAGVGALLGFGIANLGNYALWKQGAVRRDASDEAIAKWAKRYNSDWIPVKNASKYPSIVVIDRQQETQFMVQNIQDVRDFRYTFPNSDYAKSVVIRCIPRVSRNELLELLVLYPTTPKALEIKQTYIQRSSNFTELWEAMDRFPNHGLDMESKAADFVRDGADAVAFAKRYPKSTYATSILERVRRSLSYSQCEQMLSLYAHAKNYEDLQAQLVRQSPNLIVLKSNLERYPKALLQTERENVGWALVANNLENAKEYARMFPYSRYVKKSGTETYVGETSGGKRQGKGFLFEEGSKDWFYGNWQQNKREGYGEEYSRNGNYYYKGYFRNDDYSGQGEQYMNGDVYNGNFSGGLKNGAGTFRYKTTDGDWSTYKGPFKDGHEHGHGHVDRPNGEWFEGEFAHGRANGVGTYRTSDGFRITGNYKEGVRVGRHNVQKWALFGLVDIYKGEVVFDNEGNAISSTEHYNINNASTGSNSDEDDEREKEEAEKENQEKNEKKAKRFESDVKECISDLDEALDKVSGQDGDTFSNLFRTAPCPCLYFEDSSFWGTSFYLISDNKSEWYYNRGGLFSSTQGPFQSKYAALRQVCEEDNK